MNRDAVDKWSIIHGVSGVGYGLFVYVLNTDIPTAILVGFAISLAWEALEYVSKEGESNRNRISDIILGAFLSICTYVLCWILIGVPSDLFTGLVLGALIVYAIIVLRFWYLHSYKIHNK